ncbi:hypothetical protein Fot_14887 [Forsythia ovata]|uniref:Uncharacterized protein n=1 Tax=Forsythia ovata TaxID=205694 RepID=A0ABD1W7L1_9LAMI
MAILEKLPFPSITAAGSIHNIRAREGADLLELIKMAEMNTYRSHVLNCEVYKVLAMKVDELRSMVTSAKDIDALRSKNKVIRTRLAIVEDARAQAVFKITKFEMIQRTRINAKKQAELKLKVCEDMAHAKHKELTESLAELSKAKDLLAKLGLSGYADPKVHQRRRNHDHHLKLENAKGKRKN